MGESLTGKHQWEMFERTLILNWGENYGMLWENWWKSFQGKILTVKCLCIYKYNFDAGHTVVQWLYNFLSFKEIWRKIILYLPRDGGKKTLYLPLMFNNFFSNSSSFIVVILYLFEHIKGKGNPVEFCVFVYKYLKINLRSPTPNLFFILFIDILQWASMNGWELDCKSVTRYFDFSKISKYYIFWPNNLGIQNRIIVKKVVKI